MNSPDLHGKLQQIEVYTEAIRREIVADGWEEAAECAKRIERLAAELRAALEPTQEREPWRPESRRA